MRRQRSELVPSDGNVFCIQTADAKQSLLECCQKMESRVIRPQLQLLNPSTPSTLSAPDATARHCTASYHRLNMETVDILVRCDGIEDNGLAVRLQVVAVSLVIRSGVETDK